MRTRTALDLGLTVGKLKKRGIRDDGNLMRRNVEVKRREDSCKDKE